MGSLKTVQYRKKKDAGKRLFFLFFKASLHKEIFNFGPVCLLLRPHYCLLCEAFAGALLRYRGSRRDRIIFLGTINK
jgi:hypothetical protein